LKLQSERFISLPVLPTPLTIFPTISQPGVIITLSPVVISSQKIQLGVIDASTPEAKHYNNA